MDALDGSNYQKKKPTSKENHRFQAPSGFTSESEAQEWGQKELKVFLQNLRAKNKNRAAPNQEEQKSDSK